MSALDRQRLGAVTPAVRWIIEETAKTAPLVVVEGRRSPQRHRWLVEQGQDAGPPAASPFCEGTTVRLLPVVHGEIDRSWAAMTALAKIMKGHAEAKRLLLTWGGDWLKSPDGAYFRVAAGRTLRAR